MNWISVEDNLPEANELVIIMVNSDREMITVGCIAPDKFDGAWKIGNQYISWDWDFSFGVEMNVTHWAALSELPVNN